MTDAALTELALTELIERAFDYRGYVTLHRQDGSELVGFMYNRGANHVELFDQQATRRIRVSHDDIANIVFTGDDYAARAQQIWERRGSHPERAAATATEPADEQPVLFVVALPLELRALANAMGTTPVGDTARGRLSGRRTLAVAVGVGGGAARAVAAHRPAVVVSYGVAGALDAELRAGDLVLASSIVDELGDAIAAPSIWRHAERALAGDMRVFTGEFVCATGVAITRADKRALARPGRLAVDLESWAVARAADRAGVPWLALRAIVDPAEFDLPSFANHPRASYVAPALRHALAGPRAITQLARLGWYARTASRSLQRAAQRLAPVLGADPPMEASQ